jgi:hypothetical protein
MYLFIEGLVLRYCLFVKVGDFIGFSTDLGSKHV